MRVQRISEHSYRAYTPRIFCSVAVGIVLVTVVHDILKRFTTQLPLFLMLLVAYI